MFGCEVRRVLAGCVVCDMVAGGKSKQPYHVLVLGVEESEADIGLSVSYRTCIDEYGYGFQAYAHIACYVGDHGIVQPWLASMDQKRCSPCKEYWY